MYVCIVGVIVQYTYQVFNWRFESSAVILSQRLLLETLSSGGSIGHLAPFAVRKRRQVHRRQRAQPTERRPSAITDSSRLIRVYRKGSPSRSLPPPPTKAHIITLPMTNYPLGESRPLIFRPTQRPGQRDAGPVALCAPSVYRFPKAKVSMLYIIGQGPET